MSHEDELSDVKPKAVELRNERSWNLYNKQMYLWVRENKPELMAEAGVAGGATSYCILKAMEKNDKGELWSFDPGHEHVGDDSHLYLDDAEYKEHKPGELIPSELKNRWNYSPLKFVEGEDIIKNIANEKEKFDAFFHDSDHSDENINAEFEMMKDYVKEDGYFLIHDPPTDKVWSEFELVEGVNTFGDLVKGITPEKMQEGATQWALKIFTRG